VLAAYDESVPFMGDEALEAIASLIGPRKYTLPHYLSFHKALTKKAAWLADQDGTKESEWTPQRVQLCLYAEAKGAAKAPATKAPAPAKRKAAKAVEKADAKDTAVTAAEDADATATTSGRRTRRKTDRYSA
jgi:hypothetical protein